LWTPIAAFQPDQGDLEEDAVTGRSVVNTGNATRLVRKEFLPGCEIAEIRHSSLYAPRDFDISPYFMVVKPTLARGFNYKDMHWADLPEVHTAQVTLAPEIEDAIAEVA